MNLRLFCVFDSKAMYYAPPFTARTNAEAIRMFADTANDVNTRIGQHPSDFTLMVVGEFDSESGRGCFYDAHLPLGTAVDFVESAPSLPLMAREVE